MTIRHGIVGSEAFQYADHRLSPAHGSIRMFGARRRRLMPRWFWPSLLGSGMLLLMAIGKTVGG